MVIDDLGHMGGRRLESRPQFVLEAVQERACACPDGQLGQPFADRMRQPRGVAARRGERLIREACGSVDDPGKTAAQAGPVLVDTGTCQGEPVEGPEERNGTSLVHRLTGLILVASCPYWS